MKQTDMPMTVGELFQGYANGGTKGATTLNGQLIMRPSYQRELIYSQDKNERLIRTVLRKNRTNNIYFAVREDGLWDLLDGLQRLHCLLELLQGNLTYQGVYFNGMPPEKQEVIRNHKLQIVVAEGSEEYLRDLFEDVNVSGEALTKMERLSCRLDGEWLTNAREYFCQKGKGGHALGGKYAKAAIDRQGLLEKALKWYSDDHVRETLSKNRHKTNCRDLIRWWEDLVSRIEELLPEYDNVMKNVNWGDWARLPEVIRATHDHSRVIKIRELLADNEIKRPVGIYEYVFNGNEQALQLRSFTEPMVKQSANDQEGRCWLCKKPLGDTKPVGHHEKRWRDGGKTTQDNCRAVHPDCNLRAG